MNSFWILNTDFFKITIDQDANWLIILVVLMN
jgi:hypothetical protein